MSSFGEVLKHFKENEAPHVIAPLIEDAKLVAGLVAWQSVKIKNESAGKNCEETDPLAKWEWLWNQCKIDLKRFSIVSGVQEYQASDLFLRLQGLRLIYPDGTIHSLASQFLEATVLKELPRPKRTATNG